MANFYVWIFMPFSLLGDFCPVPGGSKNVNTFWRNLMGKLELSGAISCPLMTFLGRPDTRSIRGHRPSLTSETQSHTPYDWPGINIFLNFFSRASCENKLWRVYWPTEFYRSNFGGSGDEGHL